MTSFDVPGALAAGWAPSDVTGYLAQNPQLTFKNTARGADPKVYDVAGALKAGLTPESIVSYLYPATRPALGSLVDPTTSPPSPTAAANTSTSATTASTPTGNTTQDPATPSYVPAGYREAPTGVLLPITPPPAPMAPAHLREAVSTALGSGVSPSDITTHLSEDTGPVGQQMRTALRWGYSPAEIVDHLNPQNPAGSMRTAQGLPILAPIMRGAAQAQAAVANLAGDVGLSGVAKSLRSSINQEDLTTPTSGAGVVQDIKAGHYGQALAAVPSAILEGAPPAGAAIAGGMAAGPVGAALAGAGIGAVTQGDAIARARAANNGEAAPSASDLALGVAGGAGVGALGSVGLPGAIVGTAGAGLKGALMSTAAHATADAVMPQAGAMAGSVGTSAGARLASGSDSAAAALEGLAGRAAMAAPGLAASYTPSARSAALASRYAALTPDEQQMAQNTVAAHAALNDAAAATVGTPSFANARPAAMTASDAIHANVARLVGTLSQQGIIDGSDAQVIGQAMRAARSPGLALTQDHLDDIDGLGLQDSDATALKNAAVQMNLLADPASLKASVGPFQGVAHVLGGHWGGALAGTLIGGPAGATAGYVAGAAIRPILSGALGSLGAALDGSLGLGLSPLDRAATNSRAMLQAAGVTVPDAADDLQAAASQTRNAIAAQRAQIPGMLSPVMQAAANRAAITTQGDTLGGSAGPGESPGGASGGLNGGTYTPDTSGLSPAAVAQAQRLPQWMFGLGSDLQNALQVSGQARPVNIAAEVNGALDSLTSRGWLPEDLADGLRGHQGRVVPIIYRLLLNEMLLGHGIDRTVGGSGLGGVGQDGVALAAQ